MSYEKSHPFHDRFSNFFRIFWQYNGGSLNIFRILHESPFCFLFITLQHFTLTKISKWAILSFVLFCKKIFLHFVGFSYLILWETFLEVKVPYLEVKLGTASFSCKMLLASIAQFPIAST